jgi:hypothetical protein
MKSNAFSLFRLTTAPALALALTLSLGLASLGLAAAQKKERQPATPPQNSVTQAPALDARIRIETKFAEREGLFVVNRTGGVAHIEFSNNNGERHRRELHQKDFDFIVKTLKELPRNSKIPPDCSRFSMTITTEGLGLEKDSFLSCFGVKTITSPAYSRFASILNQAL